MIQDYEEPSLSASDSDWASTARVHCECAAASLSCLPPIPASEMSGYNLQRASLAGHLLAGFLEQMLQGYMEAFHEFQMQRGFGEGVRRTVVNVEATGRAAPAASEKLLSGRHAVAADSAAAYEWRRSQEAGTYVRRR